MKAEDVKRALLARHPASGGQMPGPWTVVEEWRNIDLLAFSAWSSASRFARVGYEVKTSRSDLRSELLKPYKRAANVEWCNQFYLAVPAGLLTDEELAWQEPDWEPSAFSREPCPNAEGRIWGRGRRCHERVPVPYVGRIAGHFGAGWERILCRTCGGRGWVERSLVERTAPTVWVPRDIGLVVVDGRGCRVVRPSPIRKEVPALGPAELGKLVRWVSIRPDRRHTAHRERFDRRQAVA